MIFQLGSVWIQLNSPDRPIRQGWAALFADWAGALPARPAIALDFSLVTTLPPPPPVPLLFQHPWTKLAVYQPGNLWELRFPGRAVIQIPVDQPNQTVQIIGQLTAPAAETTQLEDITFTALAPCLRRQGWYLVHAFAVTRESHSCLLVGPSFSGKTTTGLRLVLAGWQLLGNDLVLVQNRPEGVYALPTPGQIRIRPGTLSLLPQLLPTIDQNFPDGSAVLNRTAFSPPSISRPVRVTHVIFPQVQPDTQSVFTNLSQGVTFARLAEESLDRWDTTTFDAHLDCLQKLSSQAAGISLTLGRDAARMIQRLPLD